jgi:peptide/nickel transport system substrate-binding protein
MTGNGAAKQLACAALLSALVCACGPTGVAPADEGTFTVSLTGDPGALDPYHAATFAPAFLLALSYEGLIARDPSGRPVPNLAESFEQTPRSVRFTLRQGLTCASGEPLSIEDVADNYRYVLDPANHSPQLGPGGVPRGSRLEVDAATRTLTITTPSPHSFLLDMTGGLPIVCRRGLEDRSRLRQATDGTGLFQLVETAPNSHYVLERRRNYTWGHDGTRSDTQGVPRRVVVRIIPNQTTAANLLLAGDLTAATVGGPDRRRVEAAGFQAVRTRAPAIQMWFNQAPGRIGADARVRRALALAIDVPQLARIASAGLGLPPMRLAGAAPMACPGDVVSQAPTRQDIAAANALLESAGWVRGADGIRSKAGRRLSLSLSWDQDLNDPTSSAYAAEYAVSLWRAIGAEVRSRSVSGAAVGELLFGTGDYDISWTPIVVSMPSRFLLFVSGSPPPGGLNFPHARIAGVERLIDEANALPGRTSCPKWDEIERLYLRDAAVLPVFDSDNAMLTRGATFRLNGLTLVPTSIRLVG